MGFTLDIWDYVALGSLCLIGIAFLGTMIFFLGLPGRIAIARKHPEADAVYTMGWLGFIGVVPWIQAFIWAFKPTDVVDLRYLPSDVKRETEEMVRRLQGRGAEASGEDAQAVKASTAEAGSTAGYNRDNTPSDGGATS